MSTPDGADPFADNPAGAITEAQQRLIAEWLERAAPAVGLNGWRIYVSTHEASPDCSASSSVRVDSDEAWVAVQAQHAEVPERMRRHTLTHELIHLHVQPFLQPIVDLLEASVSSSAWDAAAKLLRSHEERTIDRLAWALSEYLPPCPDL